MLPKRSIKKIVLFLTMILAVALCFGGMALADLGPPPLVEIVNTSPDAGATDVSPALAEITIQFNVDVSFPPAPYTDMMSAISLKEAATGDPVAIHCAVSGDSLIIHLEEALKANTGYQFKLPFGAVGYELMDGSGVWWLNSTHQINFSTGAPLPLYLDLLVDPDEVALKIGGLEEQQLIATTDPLGAAIGYLSGNNAVATVSAAGLVEAVGPGSTAITVTASKAGYVDPAPVIIPVNVAAGDLDLLVDPDEVELEIGGLEAQQLTATTDPVGAAIGYLSGNNAVATVSAAGLVEAVGPGSTTITVTASKAGYVDPAPVIIPVNVAAGDLDLLVDPDEVELEIGGLEAQQLTATTDPLGAAIGYLSGNNAVATVSAAGLVEAVGPGSTTITVTASKAGYTSPAPVIIDVTVDEENSVMKGDLNGDGIVNVLDVVMAINIALGKVIPTPDQLAAADMNGDGIVNVLDVVMMINLALGK